MPPMVALAPGSTEKKDARHEDVVELLVCNARFHRRIEIAGTDLQVLVHPRKIDSHPASQCQDIAFQTYQLQKDQGTLCRAEILTISLASSVDCAKATASGGTQG